MTDKPRDQAPVLMVTHTVDGPAYGLITGQAVSAARAHAIQADLFVKPGNDGLFADTPQTWSAAS